MFLIRKAELLEHFLGQCWLTPEAFAIQGGSQGADWRGHLLSSLQHLAHHLSKLPWKCWLLTTAVGRRVSGGFQHRPWARWAEGRSADPFQATEGLLSKTSWEKSQRLLWFLSKQKSGNTCLGMDGPKSEILQQGYACFFITSNCWLIA